MTPLAEEWMRIGMQLARRRDRTFAVIGQMRLAFYFGARTAARLLAQPLLRPAIVAELRAFDNEVTGDDDAHETPRATAQAE